jgi:uncharacterized protein (DUF433 family)
VEPPAAGRSLSHKGRGGRAERLRGGVLDQWRNAYDERALVADLAMPTQADLGWTGCPAVESDPLRVSGAWVFRGTRIPVAALFENLEDGVSLSEFVELFPGVTDQQARQVLEHVARSTAAAVA